jgi:CIC family chloride channel protein
VLGDQPLFHVPSYQLVHPLEFGIYAILGVVGGLGSVAFVKLLLFIRAQFKRLPKSTEWVQPVAGGLLVGLLGWFMPEVLGVGYDFVDTVLGGDFPWKTVAALAVLKLIATPVCYGSGNAGGIFGPSLFIGAMIGGSVGYLAHWLLPGYTANPGAYALIGMGTAFAGIVRTPMTSVIMIFEMTRDYSIIVPLMISNLISFFISQRMQRAPIYEALALQEGVYLPARDEHGELAAIRVGQVMKSGPAPLSADLSLDAARKLLTEMGRESWTVGDQNRLFGVISARKLDQNKSARSLREMFTAEQEFPYVHADHGLSVALERMGAAGLDVVPVVSRANIRQSFGIVTLPDVLAAYGVERDGAD